VHKFFVLGRVAGDAARFPDLSGAAEEEAEAQIQEGTHGVSGMGA
jgi:hypothetical protein